MWTAKRIKELRKRYDESQEDFAKRFRLSVEAVRIWEQEKGSPGGPACVILDQLDEQTPSLTAVAS